MAGSRRREAERRTLITAAFALMVMFLIPTAALGADGQATISTTVPVGAYELGDGRDGHEITVDGFGRRHVPGEPALPSRIFAIAIPPGAELVEVTFDAGAGVALPGSYRVRPASLPRVIGEEDPLLYAADQARYEQNYDAVYGSDQPYPASTVEFVRTAGYRKYNLVDVRVMPFTYHPLSGRLLYHPDITVHVHYQLPKVPARVMVDNLARTEQIAEEIILNYEEAASWYTDGATTSRGLHDFVIITLDSLTTAVTPLVNWETAKGRNVEVVTTSWINANGTGYDLAERMRNFLRDHYPSEEWGITDVLFVGTYADVPMRRTAQDVGYGRPQTDFYFAELSNPDSVSWDADGDHQWGEDSDPIDFYAEINVGRMPWSGADRIQPICEKSVAYEQNVDPAFKKNILLLGGYFWDDTDNAELMEAKVDQPWMADWTITRMYEQNTDYWSSFACDYPLIRANVMAVWPNEPFAFVNWAGHGSPTSSHILGLGAPAFITSTDCASLNDNYPAIIFADACSNSDTDYPNIGKVMLDQGAVGFVGATKVAYGEGAWNSAYDGSSQSLDYFFTTYVTSGDYTQGAGLQRALREMYTNGLWGNVRYETFEWSALWGNPNLSMDTPAPLTMALPDGLPEYVDPGSPTDINVEIRDGVEAYVPGSGVLYYRYDGGTYLTSPLVPLGGDLYRATLPAASCGDVPEFYFSASGDGGTTIHSPFGAPASVYAATVGTQMVLFEDDFETDQGWSIYAGADTGDWERADPEEVSNDGTITQPGDDHSAAGTLCYVTGPLAGTSAGTYDVDGGPTQLTSPVFDLDGLDPIVSYWRWYYIATQWNDELVVEVSNDAGSNWVTVESIDDQETWTYVEWRVSDYVTPTSQVQVRFTADDSPNDSLVEALIDDFSVISVVCEDADCPGDLDGDNDVDLADLSQLLASYGMTSGAQYEDGDLDGDGDVDLSDLSALLAVYGTSC